jgi:hypothetical protein
MHLVIVESPYAGEVERNITYARACLHDCLLRGLAPFASHLLYTQPGVLDDNVPAERSLGIIAGLAWGSQAERTVVYVDHGISGGMRQGIRHAVDDMRAIEFRVLNFADNHHQIDNARAELSQESWWEHAKEWIE